jgi:hypothetical protein
VTKAPLLSRFVTRPGTKGVSIYKSSDPPPQALSHFFVPDPPQSSSSCPPPPPPSSFPTTAFRGAPRPLPHGILRRRWPPEIRRRPRPPPHRWSTAVGPRNAGSFLPDLPRPLGLLIPILLASTSSPSSSSAPSSPASGALPPPAAGVHRPYPAAPKLGLANASKLIVYISIFLISFEE